jgi:short-subunit dehydrogenase
MDLQLKGRTVLITGGSKGIGYACAQRFATEGCDLHLVARTAADLETVRTDLEHRFPVRVTTHPLDLSVSGTRGRE